MCDVAPPLEVRNMTEWRPDLFNTSALIPTISVTSHHIDKVRKVLEKYVLKMRNIKPVQQCQKYPDRKTVLLSPEKVSSYRDLQPIQSSLEEFEISQKHFSVRTEELTVSNWSAGDILKAILPLGEEGVTGFSTIGHIVHLNLREHHEPHKAVIGQALLQLPTARTVINKSSSIDNTFRNFSLELLAGQEEYEVTVKEGGCVFTFDFSKVYWNPRLATEHERIISLLRAAEDGGARPVLFDACAGVGPFSLPSGKFCQVFSNDLNPESFKWLEHNVKSNKKSSKNIKAYNMDARDFIRQVVKEKVIEIWSSNQDDIRSAHIVMNLPALAITFVDVFSGLFSDRQEYLDQCDVLPQVHVYCFSKAEKKMEDVVRTCQSHLGHRLDESDVQGVHFVRNVAPNKDMMRIDFTPPKRVLFYQGPSENGTKRPTPPDLEIEPSNKR